MKRERTLLKTVTVNNMNKSHRCFVGFQKHCRFYRELYLIAHLVPGSLETKTRGSSVPQFVRENIMTESVVR